MTIWLDSAILYAKKQIQLDPESGNGYKNLGFALWQKEGPDAALPEFLRSRALGGVTSNNMIGTIYMNRGIYDSAYFYFDERIQRRKSPFTMMRIGQLYLDLGQYDSARTYLEQAFLLDPQMIDLKVTLIEASLDLGNYESARSYIELYLPT